MRERVEHLGGRLVFSSKRGEGTRVLVTIPLAEGVHPANAAVAQDVGSNARGPGSATPSGRNDTAAVSGSAEPKE